MHGSHSAYPETKRRSSRAPRAAERSSGLDGEGGHRVRGRIADPQDSVGFTIELERLIQLGSPGAKVHLGNLD